MSNINFTATTAYGIAQQVGTFAVLVQNTPAFSSDISVDVVNHIDATVNTYGNQLVGSPVNVCNQFFLVSFAYYPYQDLIASISSFVGANEKRNSVTKRDATDPQYE